MSIRTLYPGDIFAKSNDGIENIAVTGGDGLLSKELKKCDPNLKLFDKKTVDVRNHKTFKYLHLFDTIIHTAALIDNTKTDKKRSEFIETNIIGTANLAQYCIEMDKRLIYISTDYVYDGDGPHKESDSINPYNLYAWSKLGGESSVKFVPNHVIIRTSFGKSKFPYKNGYDNLYTSKDYVDVIAPLIMKVVGKSDFVGTINVGTDRKTTYDYATKRNKNINKISLDRTKDFSLITDKLNNLI